MCSLQLVLGRDRLAGDDSAALPALRSLLGALGFPTMWDEPHSTLYISSPALGKRIGIQDMVPYGPAVDLVSRDLALRLEQVGARVERSGQPAEPQGLVLQLAVTTGPRPGVSAQYGWSQRCQVRTLAASLVAAIAAKAGLPNNGSRFHLHREPSVEGECVQLILCLGHDPSPELSGRVAEGLVQALLRHWAESETKDPIPNVLPEACAAAEAEPPANDFAAAAADPVPDTPPITPESDPQLPATLPDAEPRMVLLPDPIYRVPPTPLRRARMRREPYPDSIPPDVAHVASVQLPVEAPPKASLDPVEPAVPSPELDRPPAPDLPQAPAIPRAKSAYPILVSDVTNSRATLVIRGKRQMLFDPRRPPGDGPTIPFVRESTPDPDTAADPEPELYAEPELGLEPHLDPVLDPGLELADAALQEPFDRPDREADPTLSGLPLAPAPPRRRPATDPRRSVQVIQHGGAVIRLS